MNFYISKLPLNIPNQNNIKNGEILVDKFK